jgi:hypothetical protein|nr:MAG TPA: hypothetical protein [Caudoviricetes sp.]
MTTEQALQHYADYGVDGLSIEDMDLVCIHWLENPNQYITEIVENIVFCSFGNYELVKEKEVFGGEHLVHKEIYHNVQTNKYHCLQFSEDIHTIERFDFEWYEVYPELTTITEYRRKQV